MLMLLLSFILPLLIFQRYYLSPPPPPSFSSFCICSFSFSCICTSTLLFFLHHLLLLLFSDPTSFFTLIFLSYLLLNSYTLNLLSLPVGYSEGSESAEPALCLRHSSQQNDSNAGLSAVRNYHRALEGFLPLYALVFELSPTYVPMVSQGMYIRSSCSYSYVFFCQCEIHLVLNGLQVIILWMTCFLHFFHAFLCISRTSSCHVKHLAISC